MRQSFLFVLIVYLCIGVNIELLAQNNTLRPENFAHTFAETDKITEYLNTRKYKEVEPIIKEALTKLKEAGKERDFIELNLLMAKCAMHQWRADESLDIYLECRSLAKENGFTELHVESLEALVVMYQFKQRYDKVEEIVLEGMAIEGVSESAYSNFCMNYGFVLGNKSQKDSALYYAKIAYDIDLKLNDSVSMVKTLHTIGEIYSNFEEYDEALDNYLAAKSYIVGNRRRQHISFDYNIANMLIKAGNLKKAEIYIKDAIEESTQLNVPSTMAKMHNKLAFINEVEGNYEKALEYYTRSDSFNLKPKAKLTKISNKAGRLSCLMKLDKKVTKKEIDELVSMRSDKLLENTKVQIDMIELEYLSKFNFDQTQFDQKYASIASFLSGMDKDYLNRNLSYIEYNYLKNRGQYKKANKALESYNSYQNEINQASQKQLIMEMEARYDQQESVKEISELALTNEVTSLKLSQHKNFLRAIAIGLGILLLLLFFILNLFRKVSKQNVIVSDALKEKDILLREIHHRVKNNLQVISSLLSLQSRQIDDENIQKAIDEGRNRVRSMALIHQNLYQNENLTGVSVKSYLNNLVGELFSTYKIEQDQVKLKMDIDDMHLDVDTMVPFGLILNELVSNCLKHAFPDGRHGKILIGLKEENNNLYLSVKDNGVGMDLSDLDDSKSFGNKLIRAFTRKLDADLELLNGDGTTINVCIRKFKKAS